MLPAPMLSLFGSDLIQPVMTQGIKYVGSKLKLIPHILSLVDGLPVSSVFDGFSGTTRVSQAFAKNGFQVVSNDISVWSSVFGTCYLKNQFPANHYLELIKHLNAVDGFDGWFTENYGGVDNNGSAIQANGQKKPWQVHNTRKLDGIRREIDSLKLSEVEHTVALTSLILALDEVENTLGHFTSYLKNWSPRSYKTMQLRIPLVFPNIHNNVVIQGDIFNSINTVIADFSYFDPPYGSNNEKMPPSRVRYAAYYHIWTTICKNDRPSIFGAALRRQDTSDTVASSVFEEFRKDNDGSFIAVKAIDRLISASRSPFIALSYSSGGKATSAELHAILEKNGKIRKTIELDYKKNVMAEMKWTHQWLRDAIEPNREFIFLLEK